MAHVHRGAHIPTMKLLNVAVTMYYCHPLPELDMIDVMWCSCTRRFDFKVSWGCLQVSCCRWNTRSHVTSGPWCVVLVSGLAVMVPIAISLIESHERPSQHLGMEAMYVMLSCAASPTLVSMIPWILPKIHHLLELVVTCDSIADRPELDSRAVCSWSR